MAKGSPPHSRPWYGPSHALLTALLFPLLLALQACGAPPPARQLEVWTLQLSPKFDAYLKELVDQWEDRNPDVDVRWTDIPWGAVEQKLLAAVFARTAPGRGEPEPQIRRQARQPRWAAEPGSARGS